MTHKHYARVLFTCAGVRYWRDFWAEDELDLLRLIKLDAEYYRATGWKIEEQRLVKVTEAVEA